MTPFSCKKCFPVIIGVCVPFIKFTCNKNKNKCDSTCEKGQNEELQKWPQAGKMLLERLMNESTIVDFFVFACVTVLSDVYIFYYN